jgi:hypothetical protein
MEGMANKWRVWRNLPKNLPMGILILGRFPAGSNAEPIHAVSSTYKGENGIAPRDEAKIPRGRSPLLTEPRSDRQTDCECRCTHGQAQADRLTATPFTRLKHLYDTRSNITHGANLRG